MKLYLLLFCTLAFGACNRPVDKRTLVSKIDTCGTPDKPCPGGSSIHTEPYINPKEEFHIEVRCWGGSNWAIYYTNDNWITEKTIDNAIVLEYVCVLQLELYDSEREAVFIAKRYTSYKKCEAHNEREANIWKINKARVDSNWMSYKAGLIEAKKRCPDPVKIY